MSAPAVPPFPEVPTGQLIQLLDMRENPTKRTQLSRRTSLGDVVSAARALTGRTRHGDQTDEMPLSPMMGALAYLIFLELCGKFFVSNPNGPPNPTISSDAIPFALRNWAPGALGCYEATCPRRDCHNRATAHSPSPDQCSRAGHLYRLRCALAHDFSIRHSYRNKHYAFALALGERAGTRAVKLPRRAWGGPPRLPSDSTTTLIDITSLGTLAETVRFNLVGELTQRWNRNILLGDLDQERTSGDPVPEEVVRFYGLDAMTEAELNSIRADPLTSGVYCGAPGGLAALKGCYFDYTDWEPLRRST